MRFQDKIVWITGASSGIGEALAYAFHEEGARLILSARREDRLTEVKKKCHESDFVLPLDLANLEDLPEKAERAWQKFGRIDIMVHNGGISQRGLAVNTKIEVDQELMQTNYFGPVVLTKALLPKMLERKEGHLVVVSSVVGKFGTPMRSGYAASKHALQGFFDSLRAEVGRLGIDITLICPGFIHTNISIHALTADGTPQGTMDKTTLRGIAPERCARQILRAVARKKEEAYVGGVEKYMVYIKRFFPRLCSFLMARVRVT